MRPKGTQFDLTVQHDDPRPRTEADLLPYQKPMLQEGGAHQLNSMQHDPTDVRTNNA